MRLKASVTCVGVIGQAAQRQRAHGVAGQRGRLGAMVWGPEPPATVPGKRTLAGERSAVEGGRCRWP